jgi:hypothetical protein
MKIRPNLYNYFGSKQQTSKCNVNCITVGENDIERSDSKKYLGVWLDSTLSLRKQIDVKCRTALLNLYNIRKIRSYLTEDACRTIIQALVISHLDFGNSLYVGLPQKDIRRLQVVQNFAAKTVLNKSKYDSATEALFKLHWLPIRQRIHFKIIVTVFKCLHGCAPVYLSDLLNERRSDRYALRSTQCTTLNIPRYKCKTFGQRSFSYQGPRLWNDMPSDLKQNMSLDSFKTQLKTHLFRKAFY